MFSFIALALQTLYRNRFNTSAYNNEPSEAADDIYKHMLYSLSEYDAKFSTHAHLPNLEPIWSHTDGNSLHFTAYSSIVMSHSVGFLKEKRYSITIPMIIKHLHENTVLACATMDPLIILKFRYFLLHDGNRVAHLRVLHSGHAFCYISLHGVFKLPYEATSKMTFSIAIQTEKEMLRSPEFTLYNQNIMNKTKVDGMVCLGPIFGKVLRPNVVDWLQDMHLHGIGTVHVFYVDHHLRDTFADIPGDIPSVIHHLLTEKPRNVFAGPYFEQNIIYEHCRLTYGHEARWIFNLDLDEKFILLGTKRKTAMSYIMSLDKSVGVINLPRINCRNCNGTIVEHDLDARSSEILSCRSKLGFIYQKSGFRPEAVEAIDVHYVDAMEGYKYSGLDVSHINNYDAFVDNYNGVILGHYSRVVANALEEQGDKTFRVKIHEDNRTETCYSFKFVTCVTSGYGLYGISPLSIEFIPSQSRFEAPLNLCAGDKSKGLEWKLKKFWQYASTSTPTTEDGCTVILFLVDGNNVFLNKKFSPAEVSKRWDSFKADVVISTEMTCWAGRICTEEDFKKYYDRKVSPSPFINSAIAGSSHALSKVLASALKALNYTADVDDRFATLQLGTSMLNDDKMSVRLDTSQRLFGSTVYSQAYPMGCPMNLTAKFVKHACFNAISETYSRDCCTNSDFSMKDQIKMFQLVRNGPYACEVIRASGHAPPDKPYKWSISQLEPHPLFWHGHGPGKNVWNELFNLATKCHNKHRVWRTPLTIN